jgi:hypothetical protein
MWLLFFEIYIRLAKMLTEHDIRYCSWTYLTASIKMAFDGGCQVCPRWRIGDAILMEVVKYVSGGG